MGCGASGESAGAERPASSVEFQGSMKLASVRTSVQQTPKRLLPRHQSLLEMQCLEIMNATEELPLPDGCKYHLFISKHEQKESKYLAEIIKTELRNRAQMKCWLAKVWAHFKRWL